MTFKLGSSSLAKLEGVHPDLARVVKRAIALSRQDFSVLEGVRTQARQNELYAQGRTKPGNIVTWTRTSNHFKNTKTGYGHAVDLVPYPVDWNDLGKFDRISAAMFEAAMLEGVKIRWGADWDQDGKPRERGETDNPHFELAR